MKRGKVVFVGDFWDFFLKFLGLIVLTIATLGLLAPYLVYWQFKYFFSNLEIEMPD